MNLVPDEADDDVLAELSPELLATLEGPPDTWLAELTQHALPDVVVPRDAMWAAIQHERTQQRGQLATTQPTLVRSLERNAWWRSPALIGIAATLLAGVVIGRFALPRDGTPSTANGASGGSNGGANGGAGGGQGISFGSVLSVAVTEHLVRSEALLTNVRLDASATAAPDLSVWAHDLLGTTHLLLADPSLRDVKTRQLLEDLELVLIQVVQAHANSAPLVRRAPAETLRETNLLPRVRAASSASPLVLPNSTARGITE